MKCSAAIASAIAAISLQTVALAGPPTYRVIKLNVQPKQGDGNAEATAIDHMGRWQPKGSWISVQVATGDGLSRAVRCDPTNVCSDPFPDLPAGDFASAIDVGNKGYMIGLKSDHQSIEGYWIGIGWDGRVLPLGTFVPQALASNGKVAGVIRKQGLDEPYLWTLGRGARRLHMPPGAIAVTFHASTKIGGRVGSALTTDGRSEAFVSWGHPTRGYSKLIGTLGGPNSVATAVNTVDYQHPGHIVGCSDTANEGERRPFVWDGTSMTPLPTFGDGPACASGINDKGIIVGNGRKSGQRWPQTPFFYHRGMMYDINDLLQESDRSFHILKVSGVTSQNEIAATAISDTSLFTIAVLLQPIKPR